MTNPLRKLGPVCTRMLKLARLDRLTIPVSSGSEPELVIDEDNTVIYGTWPDAPSDHCEKNAATGRHEYSRDYCDYERCIHCGEWDR